MKFESLLDLITKLNTEAKAIAYFIHIRWNGKIKCPYSDCHSNEFEIENNKIYHFSNKKEFKCSTCKKRFSYKTGTFIENSKVPMRKWLMAMYIFIAHKKGISSCQLGRDLKVRQATAWFMLQRLREMAGNTNNSLFTGINEADECYIGGKEGNKHSNKKRKYSQGGNHKMVVMGILQRKGKLGMKYINKTNINNIKPVLDKYIDFEKANLYTDESPVYKRYEREVVNHSEGEYARGNAYTNSVENTFGSFKRRIYGIHHQITKKHIERYITSFMFYFNNRSLEIAEKFENAMMSMFSNNNLTYKMLTV